MKYFRAIAFILFLSIIPAHAEIVEQSKSLNFFSGPVLFQDLDSTISAARIWVVSIAFLILCFGVLGKIQSGDIHERGFMKVVFIFLAMVAMANSNKILEFSTDMAAAFSEELGLDSSASFAEHIVSIERTLSPAQNEDVDAEEVTSETPQEKRGIVESFLKVTELKSWIQDWLYRRFTGVVFMAMSALLWVSSWVVTIFETARYFLLKFGGLLLPIFIAGLMTRTFSSQSINYIFGLIGIICWPIGWAIGNLGTLGLFAATGRLLRGDLIVGDEQAAQAADALSDSITNGVYNEASIEGIHSLASIGAGTMLCVVLMLILTCLWVIVITITVPKFMSSLFSSGADMFSGATKMAGAKEAVKFAANAPKATVGAVSGAAKMGTRAALNTAGMPTKVKSSMLKAAQRFNK